MLDNGYNNFAYSGDEDAVQHCWSHLQLPSLNPTQKKKHRGMNASEAECSNGLVSKWWGPAWWSILHSVVVCDVGQKIDFLKLAAKVLPCSSCRANFEEQLSLPNAGSLEWLVQSHAQASGRTNVQQVQAAAVTPRVVAFVAKCIAVNYPIEADNDRCTASIQFLELLYGTFPQAFRSKILPAKTRAGMMVSVEQALLPDLVEPRCCSLEQLRYYVGWDARVERSLRNVDGREPASLQHLPRRRGTGVGNAVRQR